MPNDSLDLLKGTLDVLVLKALTWGPMHGYAVASWVRERTGGAAHRVLARALYVEVHRQPQLAALGGAPLREGLAQAAHGVDLHPARAVAPAQEAVVLVLHAGLAHTIA